MTTILTSGPGVGLADIQKRCYHAHSLEGLRPRTTSASPEVDEGAPQGNAVNSDVGDGTSTDACTTSASQRPPPPPGLGPGRRPGSGSRSGVSSDAHVRFVANLSPESAFIINNHLPAGPTSISRHGVGLWLGQDQEVAVEAAPSSDQRALTASTQVLDGRSGQTLLLSVLRPALRRECLATIPPEFELGLLSDLFFAKIDPIFPLLQEEPWEDLGEMETLAIKQCICLVAALDPSMRPHLKLPHTDEVLSQVEFRARIAAAVKQSLDLGFVTNKIVLLQVCALMAMYVDDDGFGELSAYYCAQAILHEQTLGFHVGWPDGKAGGERSRRIFWCVYVLDRLNAATNGRPTVMHRRDADQKVMDSIDNQQPPFKLLILIAQLLDYTISLYRPHAQAQAQSSAQTRRTANFEDLVEIAGAQNLSSGLLASLELFYLSAVILQDRSSENQSSSEHQGFCAARIVAVASDEDKSSLVYWPILPYSVTVAASVAYRSFRKSPMPYNRRRAFVLFRDSIQVLDDLSQAFLSARAMARLAKDTMQEVGRATERTRRESLRPPGSREDSAEETRAEKSSQEPRDTSQQSQQSQQQQQQSTSSSMPESRSSQQPDAAAGVGSATFTTTPYDQSQPFFGGGYDGNAEIFGHFDPNFDLGRTDAIFTASLDLSVPFFAEDWPSLGNNAMGM